MCGPTALVSVAKACAITTKAYTASTALTSTRHDHTRRCHCHKECLASTVNECRVIGNSGCEGAVMAQTCTRSRTRMMPTSSEDGAHASKVYQHQQHAAPPARNERSQMNRGTHSSRTAHAIEPGPKMQHSGDLGLCCILGPDPRLGQLSAHYVRLHHLTMERPWREAGRRNIKRFP